MNLLRETNHSMEFCVLHLDGVSLAVMAQCHLYLKKRSWILKGSLGIFCGEWTQEGYKCMCINIFIYVSSSDQVDGLNNL